MEKQLSQQYVNIARNENTTFYTYPYWDAGGLYTYDGIYPANPLFRDLSD